MGEAGVCVEQLVIVAIVDGVADATVAHLPGRKLGPDESPYRLVAACGQAGVVYARAGAFANIEICSLCERRLAGCGRYASLDSYNDGCRCRDCKLAMARYRRLLYVRNIRSAHRVCRCGGVKAPSAKMCRRCYTETKAACGTNSMYARGCRCDDCRAAHQVYMRAWHQRRKAA